MSGHHSFSIDINLFLPTVDFGSSLLVYRAFIVLWLWVTVLADKIYGTTDFNFNEG
jgi:hypothetical protein